MVNISQRTLYHDRSNYEGIEAKIAKLPHIVPLVGAAINGLSSLYGSSKAHTGSWGTKDFGLTELVGKAYGAPLTNQGGSNLSAKIQKDAGVLGAQDSSILSPVPTSQTMPGAGGTFTGTGSNQPTSNNNTSLRDQMTRGLIPWDDNLLNAPSNAGDEVARREAEARGAIESGYSSYFAQLDNILNSDLPAQRTAQENIAQSQYNQGLNTLTSQKEQGLQDLSVERGKTEGQQTKTLKDLADNIRNSFLAGNVYLGSRGAGDSSAADQYAYALTKLGSQQRGDIQGKFADIFNDIGNREFKIKNIYDTETRNLQENLNQQISSIAQWFSEQQQSLRLAQSQGQLAKGQDLASLSQNLLNNALNELNRVRTEASNRKSALEEWAMNNSQNVAQLRNNLASVSSAPFAQAPAAQQVAGTPQVSNRGDIFAPAGYGGSSTEERRRNPFLA